MLKAMIYSRENKLFCLNTMSFVRNKFYFSLLKIHKQ